MNESYLDLFYCPNIDTQLFNFFYYTGDHKVKYTTRKQVRDSRNSQNTKKKTVLYSLKNIDLLL